MNIRRGRRRAVAAPELDSFNLAFIANTLVLIINLASLPHAVFDDAGSIILQTLYALQSA